MLLGHSGQKLSKFPVVFHIMKAPLPPNCAILYGSDASGSVFCGWLQVGLLDCHRTIFINGDVPLYAMIDSANEGLG